jgi:hypothetical protein
MVRTRAARTTNGALSFSHHKRLRRSDDDDEYRRRPAQNVEIGMPVEVTFEDLDRGNLNHKIPLRMALWACVLRHLGDALESAVVSV